MIQSVEVLEQTLRAIQNLFLLERVKSSEIQKLVKKTVADSLKGAATEGF